MTVPSKSLVVLNLAAIVERCDEQILPAVYLFLGRSLNASLSDLGVLTLCRAIIQALASPLSGILSTHHDRTLIVASGCLLWGVMTSAIGLCTSFHQAMLACGLNGLGLALVVPTISSLLADSTAVNIRGRAFGIMGLIASLGGMSGALLATNVGGNVYWGVEGWRCAFHAVAAVSFCTAWLVRRWALDPSFTGQNRSKIEAEYKEEYGLLLGGKVSSISALWQSVRVVLTIKSFQVIVLQGIVGSIPWQALVMITLWLQLLGFSNFISSLLTAIFTLGCAVGGLLGGSLGDAAARRSPIHGRILVCQCSVLSGLPLSFLLFKGLTVPSQSVLQHESSPSYNQHQMIAIVYGIVLLIMGLTISWCGCNNSALFAELVPERLRPHIYAFDRSFEGAVGACGAPLVGIAAQRLFAFQGSLAAAGSAPERAAAAEALSNALLLCLVAPWMLCLLSYTFLHATFGKDRAAAAKLTRRIGSELQLAGIEGLEGGGGGGGEIDGHGSVAVLGPTAAAAGSARRRP